MPIINRRAIKNFLLEEAAEREQACSQVSVAVFDQAEAVLEEFLRSVLEENRRRRNRRLMPVPYIKTGGKNG